MRLQLFSSKLRDLRKAKGCSQEQLAWQFGVSVQAVSKWECAQSYPDIELLPGIADFFDVSIDDLLREDKPKQNSLCALPDDGVLRIIQCKGQVMLREDTYDPELKIPLIIDKDDYQGNSRPLIRIEVWGSAAIDGCVSGGIHAGDGVNCGNVSGGVSAGDGVNCGNVSGGVNAGDGVNCGNVSGGVNAGDGINCGNIDGDILSCDGDIHCQTLTGSASCTGNIYIEK